MNPLKQLAGQTAIYGLSSVLGRFIGYLLVPLHTSFFSTAEYGIVTELYAYAAFFNVLYTYGLETAFFRFATKEKDQTDAIFSTALLSILFSGLGLSIGLSFLATPIVNFLEYPGNEHYVYVFSAILCFDAFLAVPFAKLRLKNKAKKFAAIKLVNIFLNLLLNALFIWVFFEIFNGQLWQSFQENLATFYKPENRVLYVFIANLIASFFTLFLLLSEIFSQPLIFYTKIWKNLLNYSWPLLIMGLAGVTNEMLSRAMLKKLLPDNFYPEYSNQAALGIFGACYKLSIFMALAVQAFRYAAEPFFFSRAGDRNSPQLFATLMNWFVIFGLVVFLGISLNLNWIAPIIIRDKAYFDGLAVVPILLLANLFLGINFNLSIWYKLSDQTHYGAMISILGAIITISLNILLIPHFGYEGSAYVTLLAYLSMSLISFFLGAQHYPVPYSTYRILGYITLAVVTYLLLRPVKLDSILLDGILKTGISLFIGIIFITYEMKWSASQK